MWLVLVSANQIVAVEINVNRNDNYFSLRFFFFSSLNSFVFRVVRWRRDLQREYGFIQALNLVAWISEPRIGINNQFDSIRSSKQNPALWGEVFRSIALARFSLKSYSDGLALFLDHFIMDILGLGSKVEVEFLLDPQGQRKQVEVKVDENKRALQYIYYDGEDVGGTVGATSSAASDESVRCRFKSKWRRATK